MWLVRIVWCKTIGSVEVQKCKEWEDEWYEFSTQGLKIDQVLVVGDIPVWSERCEDIFSHAECRDMVIAKGFAQCEKWVSKKAFD
jgi:hypothetical protein